VLARLNNERKSLCTGTAPDMVLTAAHRVVRAGRYEVRVLPERLMLVMSSILLSRLLAEYKSGTVASGVASPVDVARNRTAAARPVPRPQRRCTRSSELDQLPDISESPA
jgi:hypothetical protein